MSRYSFNRGSGGSKQSGDEYSAEKPVPYELYNQNPKRFLQSEQSKICVQQMILCFYDKEPCIVLCERSDQNNMYQGKLTLPGGKIDNQNTAQADSYMVDSNHLSISDFLSKHSNNVKREVDEETGIKLTHLFGIDSVYHKPNMSIFMYGTVILGDAKNINISMDSEVSNVFLMPIDNLLSSLISPEVRYYDKKTGTELFQNGESFYEDKAGEKLFYRSRDIIGIEDNIVKRAANKFIKLTNQGEAFSNEKYTIIEGGIIIDALQNHLGKDTTHIKATMQEMAKQGQQAIDTFETLTTLNRSR